MKRLLVLILLTACSTVPSPSPDSASTGDFVLSLTNDTHGLIKPGQAAIDLRVAVTLSNNSSEPYTIHRIELASLGGHGYRLPPSSQTYDVPLAPGETRTLPFQASAIIASDETAAHAPELLRATLHAVAADGRARREIFLEPFSGNVKVDIAPYMR